MLRVRGTIYHFRRIVPPALRTALNRREIWVSLKTGYQNEARKQDDLKGSQQCRMATHSTSGKEERPPPLTPYNAKK
ncbi:DUF6538 domain-containing protein [Acetobacter orientalis]|uniref:DUF6538 domain-containing protein n=1 Tax=Acetobacter orientalis TaxID=146474 RepID=UPI0030B83C29